MFVEATGVEEIGLINEHDLGIWNEAQVQSFKQLMQFMLATIGRQRLLVPIPFALAKLQASILQLMPKPLLTPDQVELLRSDNVVSAGAEREGRTLGGLGIDPTAMAVVAPSYLWRFRKTGQFRRMDVRDQTPDR